MFDTETDWDRFLVFRHSLWHGRDWPQKAKAVLAQSQLTGKAFFSNTMNSHVEQEVISFLRTQFQTAADSQSLPSGSVINICIYINYTPCHECSLSLVTFVADAQTTFNIQLKLRLVCAGLYNINRQSCRFCFHRVNDATSSDNSQGLKHLVQAGVELKTFDTKDWNELSRILGVAKYGSRGT